MDCRARRDWGVEGVETLAGPYASQFKIEARFTTITAAHLLSGEHRQPLRWSYDAASTKLQIELPSVASARMPATIVLERTLETKQFPDGRIVFSAMDAKVSGDLRRVWSRRDYYGTARTTGKPEVSWE